MKLLTWNMQWGRGAAGRVDLDRTESHAKRFADFDVLCVLQVSAGHHQLPLPTEDGVMSMQRAAIEATLVTPLDPLRATTASTAVLLRSFA